MKLPVRLRLTLAFAVGMAVVLSALGAFLYFRLGRELLGSIDMGLRSRAEVLVAGIDQQAFADSPGRLIDPDEAFAQLLDGSGEIRESTQLVSGEPLVSAETLRSVRRPTFVDRSVPGVDAPARLLVVPLVAQGQRLFVVVGATLSDRHEALVRLLTLLAIGGPAALLLTSIAGWLLAGAALRPVERMRAEAAAISASEPERRLPVPATGDELAGLATTLNGMLDRLQEALGRERRFVDDASHEVRTPLSILKAELDLALSRARTADELEAVLRRASAETDRLALLAEDLLVLSRTEGGRLPVHRVDVGLREVLEEACAPHRERAIAAGVVLELEASTEPARIDPVRIRQAVTNLLDNALRHAGAGGTIRVGGRRGDAGVQVWVEDSGDGFPADLLHDAFVPFRRGRNEDGHPAGAGLGLAIVRAVAEAHGGSAAVENRPQGGARVTLSLDA